MTRRGAKAVIRDHFRAWIWKWFGVDRTESKPVKDTCPACGWLRPRRSLLYWMIDHEGWSLLIVMAGMVALLLLATVFDGPAHPDPYGAPTGQCWDGPQGASYPC